MRHVTRVAGFFLNLVLLQLVLVGGGYGCRAVPMDAMSPVTAGASTTAHPHDTAAASMPEGRSHKPGTGNSEPCRLPWAPSGCQSMAPCAPTALASAPVAFPREPAVPDRMPVLIVRVPDSPARPPELPPPRA